ncbi:MAG: protease HtpX [Burkholderiaceae bacterium]|jgi:heat shock protein HtpX|nr:protease HtpX [Burkholderiaceae bacterium]
MKRIFLFLLTNLAVMVVVGAIAALFGLGHYEGGLTNIGSLMALSLVVGFTGAIISLLMSKFMAKMSMGVRIIQEPGGNADEAWLLATVRQLADQAGIGMPDVGIYEGEPNAFATGAFKNSALVAVSTGLLQGMSREEVKAVLGHEIAHVTNGDMVTMTLIQGVMNTFVFFASRVIGSLVDSYLRRDNERGSGVGYFVTVMVLQVVFGLLANIVVAWFSRQREFRADSGSARLLGQPQSMIRALERLGGMHAQGQEMPKAMAAMGIAGLPGHWFASHPPMEARIAALRAGGNG